MLQVLGIIFKYLQVLCILYIFLSNIYSILEKLQLLSDSQTLMKCLCNFQLNSLIYSKESFVFYKTLLSSSRTFSLIQKQLTHIRETKICDNNFPTEMFLFCFLDLINHFSFIRNWEKRRRAEEKGRAAQVSCRFDTVR